MWFVYLHYHSFPDGQEQKDQKGQGAEQDDEGFGYMKFFEQSAIDYGPKEYDSQYYDGQDYTEFQGSQFQYSEIEIKIPFGFYVFGGNSGIGRGAHLGGIDQRNYGEYI